jgi:uncharacterized protein (DUF924 family)
MNTTQQLQHVHTFWFSELSMEDWFGGGEELDARIREKFGDLHQALAAGEGWQARTDVSARVAEVVVLDQFSRQIYRGSGQAFAYDALALTLAQELILKRVDQQLSEPERMFVYMPFMHAESSLIQAESVRLFEALGQDKSLEMACIHKDIVNQFGRFPHRNEALGRQSTNAEEEYLANNQEAFF